MSSRFVSAGTIDAKTGEAAVGAAIQVGEKAQGRLNEWEFVREELENERREREKKRRAAGTGLEEKSLYEVLQANKAAKQAAFEEAHKLKNQFRALDEDEVGFLDSVQAAVRAEEERLKMETEEGLKAFRERRAQVVTFSREGEEEEEKVMWGKGNGRKRRRAGEGVLRGVKRRVSEVEGESGEKVKEEKAKRERDENMRKEEGITENVEEKAMNAGQMKGGPPPEVTGKAADEKAADDTKKRQRMNSLVDYTSSEDDDSKQT